MPKNPTAISRSAADTKSQLSSVTLSPRGVARVKSGHPWVYRSDISVACEISPGATVRILDPRGKFLGSALYSSSSQIAIRMIAREEISDLPALVSQRIREAIAYRKQIVSDTNAYRIAFSEADFLPGLIIDRFNDVVSVQILTQAMDSQPIRGIIIETLLKEFHPQGIIERVDPRIRELEQLPPRQSGLLWGKKTSTIISMNGGTIASSERREPSADSPEFPKDEGQRTKDDERPAILFHYAGLEGQKTGSFLDQRENYAAATRYAHGDALDVFCYQGGFALHLAPRCSTVTGVDSSRPALEVADKNAALNAAVLDGKEVEWIEANAFDLLRDYAAAARHYNTIVLDPPAFAKTKRDLHKALSGYKELNLRALKMLQPGGILVTCSCSFHVGPTDFLNVVAEAARDAHKSLRLLENRAQAQDHPILLNVPETAYLKCLILSVND